MWHLYARWDTRIPLWVAFDLQLAAAYLQVTVRFDEAGKLEKYEDYVRWFLSHSNAAIEETAHAFPDVLWNAPALTSAGLNGHKLVTLAQYEEPRQFVDFGLSGLMELAERGRDVIARCLTPEQR